MAVTQNDIINCDYCGTLKVAYQKCSNCGAHKVKTRLEYRRDAFIKLLKRTTNKNKSYKDLDRCDRCKRYNCNCQIVPVDLPSFVNHEKKYIVKSNMSCLTPKDGIRYYWEELGIPYPGHKVESLILLNDIVIVTGKVKSSISDRTYAGVTRLSDGYRCVVDFSALKTYKSNRNNVDSTGIKTGVNKKDTTIGKHNCIYPNPTSGKNYSKPKFGGRHYL